MGSITLNRVALLTPEPLFRDLSFTLGEADKLGLVAGNGAGKSSLLRCLAGTAEPSQGDITRSRGLAIGFVEQEVPDRLLDLPLQEAIRRALPPVERDSQEWRVGVVLDEFESPEDLRDRPVRALSGGWQRLAMLARAWIAEPDALLLDEPTNHLDLAKVRWLEGWIAAQRLPMVIASHDRAFLDACATRTLFLRPDVSRLYAHPYTRARDLLADDEAAAASKLARDGAEADRLRRSAAELRNLGINSRSDAAQKKSKQMADRAAALESTLKAPVAVRSGDIRLANRGTHAKVMLALEDIPVTAPDGRLLFRTGKRVVFQGERILLTGPNGAGKTRLLELLRGAIARPDSVAGVKPSPSIVLGHIDQQMAQLPAKQTAHGFIAGQFRLGDQPSRRLLAGAGIAIDRQEKPIAVLSPGQKARLGLLALRLTAPNFYLMDEPTNHVDIPGQEALESEILAQGATCMLVSHDRRFVATVATRLWRVERGRIEETDA